MQNFFLFSLIFVGYAHSIYAQEVYFKDLRLIKDSNPNIPRAVLKETGIVEKPNKKVELDNPDINQKLHQQRDDCANSAIPEGSSCEECGISYNTPNIENKIVGGVVAVPNSWPAQTFVLQRYNGSWRFPDGNVLGGSISFSCGGSLITRYTILTAAHCRVTQFLYPYNGAVYILKLEFNDQYPTWESMFGIYPGYQDISTLPSGNVVEKVIVHENYNTTNFLNDIALLNLKEKVVLNEKIQLACMPPTFLQNSPAVSSPSYAVGWGRTSNTGSGSALLKNVKLTIYGPEYCEYDAIQNWDAQICSGDINQLNSVCSGDSGGGLYIKDTIDGKTKYVLVGLTSYGRASGCTDAPAVFTKVGYFLPWIKQNWKIDYTPPPPTTTKSNISSSIYMLFSIKLNFILLAIYLFIH